jgi:hypothetical protein
MSSANLSNAQLWDAAIEDARRSIQNLYLAIAVFEENKHKKEPWPGIASQGKPNAKAKRPQHSV